ncbi:MAG: HprK-related kinase B [Gammaproteobacteria bacterium]|nr:HprK-related kinase B [Gammaproteobacteria bacterium]
MMDLVSAATALKNDASICGDALYLRMGDCTLRLRSNSAALISGLSRYFVHASGKAVEPDLDVLAIECEAPNLDIEFVDWVREPGKTGRKDAYYDFEGGRLIKKVRTGMVFLQSESERIAAGPCIENDNQVINFINAQYMNWLQHRQWLICHASGLVYHGQCLGMAGFSGGGKSTLMLHLMEHEGISYLTNDRLFIRQVGGETRAEGIPKLPRINPGTIVHNKRLHSLIKPTERERLLNLPPQALWEIEEKYDVQVEALYGRGKVTPSAPLSAFLVLNWQRDSNHRLELKQIDINERRDLLKAIMKSPGPFYQYADGSFYQDTAVLEAQAYIDVLRDVKVFEASGGVDFDGLIQRCLDNVMG